jgi:hypothetical protein
MFSQIKTKPQSSSKFIVKDESLFKFEESIQAEIGSSHWKFPPEKRG